MFMALTNSLVVLFIAVLLQIFEETFTAMLLVFHCCGRVYRGNSQVSYRTIGPALVLSAVVRYVHSIAALLVKG